MQVSRRFCMVSILISGSTGCLPSPPATTPPASTSSQVTPSASPSTMPVEQTPATSPSTKEPRAPAMPGGIVHPDALLPQTPQQSLVPPALNPPANMPGDQAVRAGVGVGAQGRSLDNESGVLVTPAKVFFSMRERVIFDASIPQALNLFEATEGRKPKSHDEFMTRIIQANNIQLPRLPPDRQYVFDPQQGELLVVRQKR